MQRIADLLAAEGIVAFRDNPAHRRAKLVTPTQRGRDVLAAVNGLQADWARQVSDGMTAGELEAAAAILQRIRARLEEADAAEGAAGNGDDRGNA